MRTPLAEKGELLVAILSMPAMQTPFIHAFELKTLQLGTEDVVLGGRCLAKVGQTFRRQKHLHRPCSENTRVREQQFALRCLLMKQQTCQTHTPWYATSQRPSIEWF